MSPGWVADPCNIEHCRLIYFLAEDTFIYVNKNYNIQRITKEGSDWSESGILYTNLPPDEVNLEGDISHWSYIEDMELDRKAGTVRCRVEGNREDIRGDREYQLEFSGWFCYHFEIIESIIMNFIVKLLINFKKFIGNRK